MRHPLLTVPLLMFLVLAGPARVEADEPMTHSETSNFFEVWLMPNASKEEVTEQILTAGQDQLVAACTENPAEAIRVYNPLASGDYTDLTCASALGGESTGEASAALSRDPGDERLGQAQQKLTPVGFVCSALTFASALVATYALCPRATNPRDERNCGHLSNFGFGGLSFLCFVL